MKFQCSIFAVALVSLVSLPSFSLAETIDFVAEPIKAAVTSVEAQVGSSADEVAGVVVPSDVVSSDVVPSNVVSSEFVPSTEATSADVIGGEVSAPCSSCGAAVGEIGESSYFDSAESQPFASECGCTSCNGGIYETLPQSPAPETEHFIGDRFADASAVSAGRGRTLTILGGFDIEFATEDLNIFSGLLDESQIDRSQFAFSAALGRRHRSWLRSESEIAVRDYNIDSLLDSVLLPGFPPEFTRDLDVSVFSLMRNAIIEWNNGSRFTPYGGMGIGVSYVDFRDEFFDFATGTPVLLTDGDDTVFSWQVIAGVATQVRGNVSFITEYRYFTTADVNLDNFAIFAPAQFDANNLFFGAKIEF